MSRSRFCRRHRRGCAAAPRSGVPAGQGRATCDGQAARAHCAAEVELRETKMAFRKPTVAHKSFKRIVAPKIVPKPQPMKANFNPQMKKVTNPNLLPKNNPQLANPNLLQKNNPQVVNNLKLGPKFGQQKPGLNPKVFPILKIANKSWPIHKGQHKLWWKGGWKIFVPFTAITAVAIGGAYYYPDAYVSVARPYCSGITPDGCRLNWQEVPFERRRQRVAMRAVLRTSEPAAAGPVGCDGDGAAGPGGRTLRGRDLRPAAIRRAERAEQCRSTAARRGRLEERDRLDPGQGRHLGLLHRR
jgi:hypothetical protein